MNHRDKKCIWEYGHVKCECSECDKCPHYRPCYPNLKKQLKDFKRQGKPLKYMVNYVLSMEQYDETHVISAMVSLGYKKNEVIEILEYDFAINMDVYK